MGFLQNQITSGQSFSIFWDRTDEVKNMIGNMRIGEEYSGRWTTQGELTGIELTGYSREARKIITRFYSFGLERKDYREIVCWGFIVYFKENSSTSNEGVVIRRGETKRIGRIVVKQ